MLLFSAKKKINLFESFSGVGAQLEGLNSLKKSLDISVNCLGQSEWFIDAIVAYQIFHKKTLPASDKSVDDMIKNLEIFQKKGYCFSADSKKPLSKSYFKFMNKEKLKKIYPYLIEFCKDSNNYANIVELEKLPKDIDIFTYSFPCQDLSIQGKKRGFAKGTRSSCLYEVQRILDLNKKNLPKVLLLENVPNLVSKQFLKDFEDWISVLKKLGYKNSYKVLNSKDYGSSQNRKRLFLVSWLSDKKEFDWPAPIKHKNCLKKIIDFNDKGDGSLDHLLKYKWTDFQETGQSIERAYCEEYQKFRSENYIYRPYKFGPTLTASGANSRLKFFFEKERKIRYMNSKEAFRYMGFPYNKIEKLKKENIFPESRLIFLAGNSIPVETMKAVFKSIIENFF